MHAYVLNFHCKLLHVHNTAPTEVVDHILHELNPSVHAQVLVANPNTFEHAALLAEYLAGFHCKAPRNGPQPMDPGAMQSSGMGVAYHRARQANGTCTRHGQGGQSGQWLCHY